MDSAFRPSQLGIAVVTLTWLCLTQAHMIMKNPVPFGVSSLDNSPLVGNGGDFPCKQRPGVYDITQLNEMAVGTPQTLSFTGSAVHGGGSCQLSVSLDLAPAKDSTFKVIHSIIGGCPAIAPGNLNSNDDSTFTFQLPQGFPNGDAVLAWTWLNKIGNRELYMNCAPIRVTGGSDSHDVYNALPDMFVANIPASTCGNVEGEDFVYPNPGDSVETKGTALGSQTVGSACQQPTQGSGATPYAPPTQSNAQPTAQTPPIIPSTAQSYADYTPGTQYNGATTQSLPDTATAAETVYQPTNTGVGVPYTAPKSQQQGQACPQGQVCSFGRLRRQMPGIFKVFLGWW